MEGHLKLRLQSLSGKLSQLNKNILLLLLFIKPVQRILDDQIKNKRKPSPKSHPLWFALYFIFMS